MSECRALRIVSSGRTRRMSLSACAIAFAVMPPLAAKLGLQLGLQLRQQLSQQLSQLANVAEVKIVD